MSGATIKRDAGLVRAIEAAGGVRPLARKLGMAHQRVGGWRRTPRAHLFAVSSASGVPAEQLRPDLTAWIDETRAQAWRLRASARFSLAGRPGRATVRTADPAAEPMTMDLLELGLVVEALRFSAETIGVTPRILIAAPLGGAGGKPTPEQRARTQAMALAVVVGRVRAEVVAGVVGVSRQAVDNAASRYLRARDGDEDAAPGERVLEVGHVRRAKAADESLWALERRFTDRLAGAAA